MFWPCETRTSTCRSFATISSGLYRFLAIAVLLDVKDIPQVGPLQWGRTTVRGGMTDIFFSYSSADRERVRPIRDALVAQGFEVFWDQQVPAGMDWDTWIRQHLTKSKCAMAFWSATSVSSDKVTEPGDLDAFPNDFDRALFKDQQPAGRRACGEHGLAGPVSHERKGDKLPLENGHIGNQGRRHVRSSVVLAGRPLENLRQFINFCWKGARKPARRYAAS